MTDHTMIIIDNPYDSFCRNLAQTLQDLLQYSMNSGLDPLQLRLRQSATLPQMTVGSGCKGRRMCTQSSAALGLQKKVLENSGL